MPEQILAAKEPMDALHRIGEVLVELRDDVAETRTSHAVIAERLATIADHLAKLNGRVSKSEDRISSLETDRAEARGIWKFVVLMASIPAALIGSIFTWFAQHSGAK